MTPASVRERGLRRRRVARRPGQSRRNEPSGPPLIRGVGASGAGVGVSGRAPAAQTVGARRRLTITPSGSRDVSSGPSTRTRSPTSRDTNDGTSPEGRTIRPASMAAASSRSPALGGDPVAPTGSAGGRGRCRPGAAPPPAGASPRPAPGTPAARRWPPPARAVPWSAAGTRTRSSRSRRCRPARWCDSAAAAAPACRRRTRRCPGSAGRARRRPPPASRPERWAASPVGDLRAIRPKTSSATPQPSAVSPARARNKASVGVPASAPAPAISRADAVMNTAAAA